MRMDARSFAALVEGAILELPERFRRALDNVEFVVEDRPSPRQRAAFGRRGGDGLVGLYEGTPRTASGLYDGPRLPDRITVFRRPILDRCRSAADVRAEVVRTVRHEVAHALGIDDDRLIELDAY